MSRTRRNFLKTLLGRSALLSLSPAVPGFLARAAMAAGAAEPTKDTVLVVLQLTGGNDGLNTVVPYADDQYGRKRQTLRLTAAEVRKIDGYLGFHPELKGMARLFKEGRLSVVQGVGYPKSDRNHPRAMRNWHTAHPEDAQCQTGWLGRAVDLAWQPGRGDMPGVFVGPIATPFGINARKTVVPSIRTAEDLVRGAPTAAMSPGKEAAGDDNPLLHLVREGAVASHVAAERIRAVLGDPKAVAPYPPYQLAADLRTVSQLIRADVGIRIYFVELGGGGLGGFDNHAGQRDNHAALLRQLSESVAAFADDLARDGQFERVALMTFSEFGRTLSENGRRGTGHGEAQPILLAGGGLRGGLIGKHPSLTDLDDDAPRSHTDYRQVYATMLDRWLGLKSTEVLQKEFATLKLFTA